MEDPVDLLLLIRLCMHEVKFQEGRGKYSQGVVNSQGQGDVEIQ